MKTFDRRFGPQVFAALPALPGVYRMLNGRGEVVYVGKAKNLRRRLGQYRNAKRTKADAKMRKILSSAEKIEWEVCESELEASLLETRLIQTLRPKWNVAGAFSFLYPLIGLEKRGQNLWFCFTTAPDTVKGFRFHGAYRSREITGEAFFAWMRLLKFVGHPSGGREAGQIREGTRRSYFFAFRGLPEPWEAHWEAFLRGESDQALELLAFSLLENAGARAKAAAVEDDLRAIKRFYKHEARLLRQARGVTGFSEYPVAQLDRDPLFLRYRAGVMHGGPASVVLASECPA